MEWPKAEVKIILAHTEHLGIGVTAIFGRNLKSADMLFYVAIKAVSFMLHSHVYG